MASDFEQIWERVAQDLKDSITRGDLKPGTRLRIAELTARYGVSNTPIREAFRHLANLGFVENIPRRMVVVKAITLKDIEDISAIQGVLEGLAAHEAARRASHRDMKRLDDLFRRMARSLDEGNITRYMRLDADFHEAFIALSRNDMLIGMAGNVRDHIARFRTIMLRHPGRVQDSLAEHREVVSALLAHDPEAAERAVKRHITVAAELLKRIVAEGGPGPLPA